MLSSWLIGPGLLGIPIKLLVVDDYKGYGGRYFFSTNVNDAAEDIITWENRWDVEVLIRELKVLEGFLPNLAKE